MLDTGAAQFASRAVTCSRRAVDRGQSRRARPDRKSIERVTVAATKRSSFGASDEAGGRLAADGPSRCATASSVAARDVFTAWAWTMNAVVVSSSARRCSACAGGGEVGRAEVDVDRLADAGVPLVAARPVGEEHAPQRQAHGVGAPIEIAGRGVPGVPAGGVGVGDAVGDVEPAEVVVEVELAGRVVAQHPLGDGVDDDVEQRRRRRRRRGARRRRRAAARPGRGRRRGWRPAASPSSRHVGSASIAASAARSTPAERPGERPHVRQRVLAGAVDDRRHEVRQHGVGPLPAERVEQLERLLGVDRAVAVAQQVVADDGREPRPQLVGRPAGVDRAADAAPAPAPAARPRRGGGTRRPASRPSSAPPGRAAALTGRSRSVSAMPAMPWTIGSARWSPS